MNLHNIIQAINECQNGNMPFNNGENLNCFLYENTWYPLRAIVNYASILAQENREYTKDTALVKLVELMPYVKVEQLNIQNNNLVHLSIQEKLEEINVLSDMITKLSR